MSSGAAPKTDPAQEGSNEWHKSPLWLELSRISPEHLNLSVSEDRALTAVQVLLHKRVTASTPRWECVDTAGYPVLWPNVREVPVLSVTRDEFLEAYGLEDGRSPQVAYTALYRLAGDRAEAFRVRAATRRDDPIPLTRLLHIPERSRGQWLTIVPTPPLWDGLTAKDPNGQFWVMKENQLFPRLQRHMHQLGKLGANGEFKQPSYPRLLHKLGTQIRTGRAHLNVDHAQLKQELNLRTLKAAVEHLEFARDFGYLTKLERQKPGRSKAHLNQGLFPVPDKPAGKNRKPA